MKEQRQQVFAGILALVGLAGLIAVAVLLSRERGWMPGGGAMLRVQLDAAPGVRTGTPLTVGGVRVGHVRHIDFADPATLLGGFIVECALQENRTLRRGSTARVVALGVGSGQTAIELVPGPADEPALEAGATVRGEGLSAASTLLPEPVVWALKSSADRVGLAADALTPALSSVQALVEPRLPALVDGGGGAGNLASALTRLDAALAGINEVFGSSDGRRKLRETLDNLHAASGDGRALMTDARAAFAAARTVLSGAEQMMAESRAGAAALGQNVTEATLKLNRTLDLAASVLGALDPLAARMARGEGTLGKLIADDRLYEGFVLMIRRLGEERR